MRSVFARSEKKQPSRLFDPLLHGRAVFLLMVMLCALASQAPAQTTWEEKTAVQALIGMAHFNSLVLDVPHSFDGSVGAETGYTWMPLFGLSGQLPFMQAETFGAGLEGSALAGWRSKSITIYGHNGSFSARFDNTLLLLDLSMGLYLSAGLGGAGRVYLGAGPLLMFGFCDNDTREVTSEGVITNENHDRSSPFGTGIYGRAGIEFRLADKALMGLGVRVFSARMDFDNGEDDTRVNGVQFMITYTVGM